ncbi:AraC family transcriptional regulator [Mesorhizobium sp. WSM2239]|uniref:AraC family transcriptional regulator n=2 Tax=unclassified Mesorhizobium TaxID=325217 RepID=A0AAU8DJM6_9HYPH
MTQRETPNELYVESLITEFGVRLLRNYSGVKKQLPTIRGGLSAHSANTVQEFLDEIFSGKLAVAELAAVSGLSPRRFIQAFTKTFASRHTNISFAYLYASPKELLVKGNLAIAEVAYVSGFSSECHLTAAMKKYKRTMPAQVRLKR